MDAAFLLHQTIFGAVAAAGFGVLFNCGFRALGWCAAIGALALAVRTFCMELSWSLEASSFVAALAVGTAVQILGRRTDLPLPALDVVGCIPMVPGSFAAKAILGYFALTAGKTANDPAGLILALEQTIRVLLTVGALGTGIAIPTLLLRVRVGRSL